MTQPTRGSDQPAHGGDQPLREFIKYTFFKLDRSWRSLDLDERRSQKAEFAAVVDELATTCWLRTYSLVGLRADAELLLRQFSPTIDTFQTSLARLQATRLGRYLDTPYSYLAMIRKSPYRAHRHPEMESRDRRTWDLKYFVVYPMVKKRSWYGLPQEERQKLMGEHFKIGHRYPQVKINTAYSFGLDDPEFVLGFETDDPADFLQLVEDLRVIPTSQYTERETPIFTSILMPIREALDTLG
ncbi:MAG: chlorite dismutase family protein [Chloroflexi bacterium]|nr:chlorite dismutase family protein [Chloroflexota bacterium]